MEFQGLALADGRALAHGLLDPRFIASARMRDGLGEGGGEVFDLHAHRTLDVTTAHLDWMGCADSRPGRHRGDICGDGDERSGRSGGGARRRHINDHRHGRVEQRFDDLLGGSEQSARGIELDNEGRGVIGGGLLNRILDEFRRGPDLSRRRLRSG